MPTLTNQPERHVVIDCRAGHYLCFPDIAHSGDGALLCVYNEFDRHVGTRRRLMLKRSEDGGRTWDAPRLLNAVDSHCPRITRLEDGMLVIGDDIGPTFHYSTDHGRNWASQPGTGMGPHGLIDRLVELGGDVFLTTGHMHRGSQPQPRIRQAPAEQMTYISRNRGRHWAPFSILANEKCLVLCEASVIRLPAQTTREEGEPTRLLALMRENSSVGEPMYYSLSEDGGTTWGQPMPTPLIGHRPTLGWTRSGKLLVTYRDVGPDPGTKAWLGTLDELCSDFAVHGLHPDPANPQRTPKGLKIHTPGGLENVAQYCLRPITDPASATASLEVEVMVRQAERFGCGLHLGQWWRLYPDGIAPGMPTDNGDDAPERIRFAKGRYHTIRVDYAPGLCSLFVDGRHQGDFPVDQTSANTRPILIGAPSRTTDNACEAVWRRMRLATHEPRLGRDYAWEWDHASGLMPDEWTASRVLELQNSRQASPADFGYSGWVELDAPQEDAASENGGQFLCVYHHEDGMSPDYRPGLSSHVAGTWFSEADFKNR